MRMKSNSCFFLSFSFSFSIFFISLPLSGFHYFFVLEVLGGQEGCTAPTAMTGAADLQASFAESMGFGSAPRV